MRLLESAIPTLFRVIFAIISILGCYGIGHCMCPHNHIIENHIVSYRDSLIQEMVRFIQPEENLSKTEIRHIERRIKGFQHRVIRRDTISYFLNTAYAVAYYEFYKHDYKKAKHWVDEFERNGMPYGFIPSIFRYSSVGFGARISLDAKGKFKQKKDKSSWLVPLNFSFADSLNFNVRRTPAQFIDSYLDDIPMDCDASTYAKLLTLFKDGGGRLEWLNGYTRRGFIQRCVDSGRTDVLNIVFNLWCVELKDFKIGQWGYLEYINPTICIDSASIAKTADEVISYNPKRNKEQIDSLLANHSLSNVGNRVLRLLSQHYDQSRYMDVVNVCEQYSQYLDSPQLNTLHNYWGLALSNLGIFDEALRHYDIAISTSTNPEVLSTMRLNKACTLGEMGRTDEAISIFLSEKDFQKSPFERFVWNDNLGYVYSFFDPTTALYYYNQAERFLDSSILYPERKVRHFCRKAQVLNGNKYLQRLSIDEALKFTLNEFCPDIAKGVAFTELGIFNASAFSYKEADNNFKRAYKLLDRLSKEDRRISYLNMNYAQNLCNLRQYDEAVGVLTHQLNTTETLFGRYSQEYAEILRQLLFVVCKYSLPMPSTDELYREYKSLSSHQVSGVRDYDDIMLDVVYSLHKNEWINVKHMVDDAFDIKMTPMQRLELCKTTEKAYREHCTITEYNQAILKLIPLLKADVINGLLLLTGDEKRAMQVPVSEIFDGAVGKGAYECALDLSLFRKGLLFATRQAVERRLANGRKTKQRYKKLIGLREDLNTAVTYNDTLHIPQIASSVSLLERELGQMIYSDKEIYKQIDKNLPMVTSALGTSDLAVDFARYKYKNEYRYGAFIINCGGFVKFVTLGTESELRDAPEHIWRFLLDGFSGYSNIYFSTDGFLNNVGIEYLNFEDGTAVSSLFNLHRVFHLSDIKPAAHIGDHIVAIGVSDHNSPIGEGETIDRGSWTDLPNVAYEMLLITDRLKHMNPQLLFNDDATEQSFKMLSGSGVSTLHISTHGFFRSEQMLNDAIADSDNYDYNIARRFLSSGIAPISGLVMRQGNISWQIPEILDESDDLLTAEEIQLMNFPNLRLTVLSACDTGLGNIDEEGVWGLQRAFRIAGTKSLICSINKVDDYWTAQFMDAFYEQAAQGKTIYDSFHKAQRWLRHELPDNPEIWSSLILIE